MACNRPIPAYYNRELNPSGKRGLTFNRKYAYTGPIKEFREFLSIPCGKCAGCQLDASLVWSIRAYHESTLHRQNSFVTLTYDEKHLPKDGKISKRELQNFFKRLRKHQGKFFEEKIRYVACGEYGGLTRRPHYHCIIFGRDWLEQKVPVNDKLYTAPDLIDIWGNGHVSIAPVNMATICYVNGYVSKKMNDKDTFILRSNKPGIGHEWIDKYFRDSVHTGMVVIEGREYPIPKRYMLWHESKFALVKEMRKEYARKESARDGVIVRSEQDSREINRKSRINSRKEVL